MIFEAEEAKNKDIENYEDIPKDKVERQDGLPTKDDLEEIMGMKKPMGMGGESPTIKLIIQICGH